MDNNNSKPRERQPNFSLAEEILIVEEVDKRKDELFGTFCGSGGGLRRRQAAWAAVAAAVTSQSAGGVARTGKQVRKKYENIKAVAKTKASQMRRPPTGGGPPPKAPKLSEQILLDTIADSPVITGIYGGIDSDSLTVPAPSVPSCDQLSDPFLISSPSTSFFSLKTPLNFPISISQNPPTSSSTCTISQPPSSPQPAPSPPITEPTSPVPQPTPAPAPLFPLPQAPKQKRPRSDKLQSDLHLEVLRLEAERIRKEIELAETRKAQEQIEHDLKVEVFHLKKSYYTKMINQF